MKKVLILLISLYSALSFAQRINEYEFVIIPTKFEFQRTEHEYRLNDFLKNRLADFGFQTFYNTDQINDIYSDPCLCLTVNVVNVSNIFLTKLQIVFKDCNNAIVFQSVIGTSEEKDRYEYFNEALTNALKSVKDLNYKFSGKKTDLSNVAQVNTSSAKTQQAKIDQTQIVDFRTDQVKLEIAKEELAAMQVKIHQAKIELGKLEQARMSERKVDQIAMQRAKSNSSALNKGIITQKKLDQSKLDQSKKEEVRITTTAKQVLQDDSKLKDEKTKQDEAATAAIINVNKQEVKINQSAVLSQESTNTKVERTDIANQNILFATPTENGFNLIDATQKVVLELVTTMQPNYFNANVDTKYGIVFKKNNQWVFEYYMEGQLIVEELTIKF